MERWLSMPAIAVVRRKAWQVLAILFIQGNWRLGRALRGAHTRIAWRGGSAAFFPTPQHRGFRRHVYCDTPVAFAALSPPTTWITYVDGHSDFGRTPEVDKHSVSGSSRRSTNRARTGGFSSCVLRTYDARRSPAGARQRIPGHGDGGTPEGERTSQGGEG